jgi:sorting nexin-9/18/33
MATLPRATKPTPSAGADARPLSDAVFDAGIHSSNAWKEHLEHGSLSDDEPEPSGELQPSEETAKAARALYDFKGKAEFRELAVEAGDELSILKEEAGDGWSLARVSSGEIGLLPQTYYTVNAPSPSCAYLANPVSEVYVCFSLCTVGPSGKEGAVH